MREKKCLNCNVIVRGDKLRCPLCGNNMPDSDELLQADHHSDVFPYIEAEFKSHLAVRILVFISVVTVILSFAINRYYTSRFNWPLLILLGLGSMWLIAGNVLLKRRSIAKVITWQVTILGLLALIWDRAIGWQGWSLDFAIPIICTAATGAMFVIAQVRQLEAAEYLVYLSLTALFGLVPLLFILFGWVHIALPSVICVVISAIMLSAILIFQWESIRSELDRRLHI